jgi:hypothetical protein
MNNNSDIQTIVLKEKYGDRYLSMGIGNPEVNAIKIELAHINPPRPLTHDLLVNTIESLGFKVKKIVVTKLQDSTYFAKIHLSENGKEAYQIDARPSDSIALALRTDAPIYASDDLLQRAKDSKGSNAK